MVNGELRFIVKKGKIIPSDPHPLMLYTLVHLGDKEDNHCQEDGQAKLAWRETRIFGGFGLFVLSSLLD